jgi:hypothetical protein
MTINDNLNLLVKNNTLKHSTMINIKTEAAISTRPELLASVWVYCWHA